MDEFFKKLKQWFVLNCFSKISFIINILIKKNDSEISKISVSMLNEAEKIGEIARMLSGETLEDEAYILAKKMIR